MGATLINVAVGGVCGVIATAAMTGEMWAAQRLGLIRRLPPTVLTAAVLSAVGHAPRTEERLNAATLVAHVGYGASCGGLFALLAARLRVPLPTSLQGVLYGSALWALSYAGWAPLLGLLPPPTRARRGRPLTLVPAHWVYGGVLGALMGRWLASGDPRGR